MWDATSNGNDQGGFFNSPSQLASTEKQDKTGRRVQNVVPATVRQILESPEDGLKIGSLDVHTFVLVALVRRVEVTTTNVTYLLDDCTGGISAVFWLASKDGDQKPQQIPPVVENTYCRVFGSMRTYQGKRHVFVFRIMNLDNLNDLTRHILEVMYTNLKMGTSETSRKSHMDNSHHSLSNSLVATSTSNQPAGFNPQQNLVYYAILKFNRETGAERDEIIKTLAGKMSAKEVANAVDFLSNEGHIYTTIDDDHFRCTDN